MGEGSADRKTGREVSRACKSWKLGLGEVLLHEDSIMVIIKGTDSAQQPESVHWESSAKKEGLLNYV